MSAQLIENSVWQERRRYRCRNAGAIELASRTALQFVSEREAPLRAAGPMVKLFAYLGMEALVALSLSACSGEKRTFGSDLPQSAPTGPDDPRVSAYEQNVFQVSQGGRYFTWYGCGGCHGDDAKGLMDLSRAERRRAASFDRIYAMIAQHRRPGGPNYGSRIPTEQIWQITAYVSELPDMPLETRRRQDIDQQGEPQGDHWAGPVE
jgi:mono/diheme cytochrome c family protein